MHVVIINGSPRVAKYSNTEKIIDSFADGLKEAGAGVERYAVSDRTKWDEIREAYIHNNEIIIAMPLYVESAPGILLEFLETLPIKDKNTRLSFILQSGFAESSQLRCGEEFLKKLPEYLGVSYGGTLIKGDNFGIRILNADDVIKITGPYKEMGKVFVTGNGFTSEAVKKFSGPEYFSLPMRIMLQLMFKTVAKKRFAAVAKEWGCTVAVDYRPWE